MVRASEASRIQCWHGQGQGDLGFQFSQNPVRSAAGLFASSSSCSRVYLAPTHSTTPSLLPALLWPASRPSPPPDRQPFRPLQPSGSSLTPSRESPLDVTVFTARTPHRELTGRFWQYSPLTGGMARVEASADKRRVSPEMADEMPRVALGENGHAELTLVGSGTRSSHSSPRCRVISRSSGRR